MTKSLGRGGGGGETPLGEVTGNARDGTGEFLLGNVFITSRQNGRTEIHNSASPSEQDKLRHFQGHRGPSHAKRQHSIPCFIIQPSPGIVFNRQLRFIVQMVSKLYLWEVKSKLNQTRLLGFRQAHFLFQESTFQHSELLLLQTIFQASSGCHLLTKI